MRPTLPATRKQRYFAAMLLGTSSVLFLTAAGALAIIFSVPQALWSLFATSGFTEPYVPVSSGASWIHSVIVPLSVFSVSFALCARGRSGGVAAISSVLGGLLTGALAGLGSYAGMLIVGKPEGTFAGIPLVITIALAFMLGFAGYRSKDMTMRYEGRQGMPVWLWILVAIGLSLLLALLVVPAGMR